ncbi:Major facilitator superfamily domain general substrate transporter [Penicillium hispanicum]|uniref:Major facilitator superfamily domain general substrate transporter n=1 Tax=Penicillium hispanicum TaxID=1080232 RepID=UPI00253F6A6A|nr:Major facilitator superfamily domain general substrate transporter [Penicillium hispanicum]KAJ5588017.1 Major facilitator superfamily domain general substrate transporter [Penicillium hispanicum]
MAVTQMRPLLRRARTFFSRKSADRTTVSVDPHHIGESTETKDPAATDNVVGCTNNESQLPQDGLQHGVSDAEAIALTWSKKTLVLVFINIWFLYFVNAFQSSVYDTLSPYVASYWEYHSLSGLPTAIADACSAAILLPTAKLMDTWGRPQGFLLMTFFATLGLVLLAACNSFSLYCAAYTFYQLGFMGMEYCVDVVTADSSKLQNRALAYAFTSSPYIITAFAGPSVGQDIYNQITWRWGFGIWAIIFPVVAAPLYFMLKHNLSKAEHNGHLVREKSGRTFWQSVWHWTIEFDLIGVVIFTLGLVLFELPFDIADYAPHGWQSGYIIAMLVVGFSMLFFFAIHEKWFAPKPLLSMSFLSDRTVIGACLLDATYQLSNYCWNYYFTSWLQVVNDLTPAEAGYINHIFDIVSGVLLLLVGYIVRRTGYFKWLLYISVPLYILAQGLMIYFRQPNMSVGYQVMCQIFLSIGGAIFIIVEQLSILAAVDHQHFASALALLNVVGTIGDSAGLTISMTIWENTYPNALMKYLPESAMSNFDMIYNDLPTQRGYPIGTATRIAIQKAYAYAELRLLSVGTGIMVLAIPWTLMIRNINVKEKPQVKGTIF